MTTRPGTGKLHARLHDVSGSMRCGSFFVSNSDHDLYTDERIHGSRVLFLVRCRTFTSPPRNWGSDSWSYLVRNGAFGELARIPTCNRTCFSDGFVDHPGHRSALPLVRHLILLWRVRFRDAGDADHSELMAIT